MPTTTILPTSAVSLGGIAYRLCLPQRQFCEPQVDGGGVVGGPVGNATLITPVGEHWNCSTCQADEKYSIPYKQGDIIHLQTNFYDSYNPDRTNPVAGFGLFLDAVLTDGVTRIPLSGMVAYGCGGSFQIAVIDTTALALDCWTVEYTVYNGGGTVRVTSQSQEYVKVSDDDCKQTVLIQGQGRGKDCFGHCYDAPTAYTGALVEYNNSMRFWGDVNDVGGSFEKSDGSGDFFAADITTPYRLALHRKIPPFAKNKLLNQLLAAPRVLVNGERYDIDSFTVENLSKRGRMFLFSVDLERRCNSGGC